MAPGPCKTTVHVPTYLFIHDLFVFGVLQFALGLLKCLWLPSTQIKKHTDLENTLSIIVTQVIFPSLPQGDTHVLHLVNGLPLHSDVYVSMSFLQFFPPPTHTQINIFAFLNKNLFSICSLFYEMSLTFETYLNIRIFHISMAALLPPLPSKIMRMRSYY